MGIMYNGVNGGGTSPPQLLKVAEKLEAAGIEVKMTYISEAYDPDEMFDQADRPLSVVTREDGFERVADADGHAMVKDERGRWIDFDVASALMDEEICEQLHSDQAPCSDQQFFDAYCEAHMEKYDEDFGPNVGSW